MKILNDFIRKVGEDKVIHFAIGGWAVSVVSPFGATAMSIMLVIIMALSFVKEIYLDEKFDIKDINAAFLGCLTAFIANILLLLTDYWL